MSQQVPPDVDESSGESDRATLPGFRRLRRNRFYHGKLMTARDMEVEQDYHARRLESFAGAVAGRGVVAGLESTVTATDDTVTARVQRGYALDAAGRPLLLPQIEEETIARHRTTAPGEAASVSVYLSYDTCATQKVPMEGAEDACEEACTYNHVVEDVDVEVDPGPPDRVPGVDRVDFPPEDTAEATSPDAGAPLHEIARSHARYQSRAEETATGGKDRVLLGHFRDEGDAEWVRVESVPPDRVYTLDMLYAAISRHVARFNDLRDEVSALRRRVADLEEDAGVSRFEPGGLVHDRDDPDEQPAVVLTEVRERADEWIVYGDETVHDQNPDYSAHDQVVVVAFRSVLVSGLDDWESIPAEDLFDTVVEESVKFHAFPEGRLERHDVDDA